MSRRPSVEKLQAELAQFVAERDWDQFHNPKNLAMALAGECGELLEHFQWLTPEQADNLPA
ncbi:MAG: nucleotide pyrophosphohydrolase, partial [Gammaproteobacteria bacterium]